MRSQSKTSRMKKKLYDNSWSSSALVVGFFSLFTILIFSFRAVTVESVYGVIPAEIPVISSTVEDPGFHSFKETPNILTKYTPAVVFTPDAFYFGDMEAFSSQLSDENNKYIVRHVDGQPQLLTLIDTMQKWVEFRSKYQNIPKQKVMILIPTGEIPVPIVAQTIAGLRTSPFFERVILGTGLK